MWTIFKSLLNLLQHCFCFGSDACGILAPQPGIQPIPLALEVKVNHWKTTGKPGKSLLPTLTKLFVCLLFTSKSYIYKSLTRDMVWYVCSHSVGFSFYFLLDIIWSTKISNYSFSWLPRIFFFFFFLRTFLYCNLQKINTTVSNLCEQFL